MASTHTAEVVKYLRRKSSSGFDEPITYLGAEQRFVGGLRNSGVNNLEEQYILGTDTYTESYTDTDGNSIVEKCFHINDSTHSLTDYYKLIRTIYKDGTMNEDFFFDKEVVKLPDDTNEVLFGDGSTTFPNEDEIYGVNNTTFSYDGMQMKIYPSSYTIIQKEELHYISNNGTNDLLVLTKTIGRKYLDDGKREVVRESIVNHIS